MRLPSLPALLLTVLLAGASSLRAEHDGKVQIVLLGDSTTEGSIPRQHSKTGPHLEEIVRSLLALEGDLPPTNVINRGQGGDLFRRLLDSGRYDKTVKGLPGVDYLFIRFGLNDLVKRENFAVNFPNDFRELIARMRKDFPGTMLIPMTVIPYFDAERDESINKIIRQVAAEEKLTLFDIYPLYDAVLKKDGPNSLNYRRYPVEHVPAKYAEWVKPFIAGKPPRVEVMDNQLDAILGHLPNWYNDRHPSLAGYGVIGVETVKFLAPIMREKARAPAPPPGK